MVTSVMESRLQALSQLAQAAEGKVVQDAQVERAVIRREDTLAHGVEVELAFEMLDRLTQQRVGNVASSVLALGERMLEVTNAPAALALIAEALSRQRSMNGFNRLENRMWSRLRETDRDNDYYQNVGRAYEQPPHEDWVYHVLSDYSCVEVMPVHDGIELRAHGSWRNFVEHRWETRYEDRIAQRVYWQPQPSDLVVRVPGTSGRHWRQIIREIDQAH